MSGIYDHPERIPNEVKRIRPWLVFWGMSKNRQRELRYSDQDLWEKYLFRICRQLGLDVKKRPESPHSDYHVR